MTSRYQVELVWNREFHFVPHGAPHTTINAAAQAARWIENSGDGERVKETRVVDAETGKVVWAHGRRT